MSYTFSWGSLLQNQWIDSTALNSALQSFIFYSITGSNQPTSEPNFDTTSNRFLTKPDINNYIWNVEYTTSGVSKENNQYVAVQDLVPQSLTFSVYTGFSSPSVMIYNPNDGLMYVADNDAGNISSYNNSGYYYNLTYSNIYSFNPLQLGTSSYVYGLPGSASGITVSFYGTVSMPYAPYYSYLNDFSYNTGIDKDNGLLFLTGFSRQDGGGLRIFDINTHELITIPYGVNQTYCRLSFTLLNNTIFIQSYDATSATTFKNYSLNRPQSGLSMSLHNQLNGLTSSLKQIYFVKDPNNNKVIVDGGSRFLQVGNYICTMGSDSTSSPNMGIYNYTPTGNTYSLYTTYIGTSTINYNTVGTNKFVTNPLVVTGYSDYARSLYLDSANNRLYISDSGSSCTSIVDVSNSDPTLWTTLFTIYFNAPVSNIDTTPSTISLTRSLGSYNGHSCYGEATFFKNPNNSQLYLNIDFVYNVGLNRVFTSLNLVNQIVTYTQLLSSVNNFLTSKYNTLNLTNFVSAGGFNLYGCYAQTTVWSPSSPPWYNDGTITKYGLNITGVK